MKKTRRQFIISTGAALAASTLPRVRADPAPPPNITALLQASGFTPGGPNSALMAVIGDLHINLEASDPKFTEHFDDALVAELNELSPAITDLTIAGDIIVHHSVSIGGPRYPSHYALSRLEFRAAKTQMQRFRPDMALRAVPGNHDTDREENDAELWREELQLPPYQKSTLGGVPVFFLNSGQAGMLDPNQRAWFEAEASLIPPGQEVVIIAHHPSFYYLFEEIGLKRIVAQAFAKHQAPVWVVGGHGHGFAEQLFVAGSARFIQMEVTTGNPIQWGDNRRPGYLLLAFQNGHVIHRAFRSIIETGFQSLNPVNQLTPYPLKWVFDSIEFPAAIFEEGFYNRTGRLVNFLGIDLKSHIILCRSHTVRVDLSKSRGIITEYLLPAHVWNGYAPPTCSFSTTGINGPWEGVSFPPQNGQRVYRIPIPVEFRSAPNLHIRTTTQLQGTSDGLSIYGWGLAADPSKLTGYEKWLSLHYRTIFQNNLTAPTIKPAGSTLTNIEHYAFNIPLPAGVSAATGTALPPDILAPVTGTPVYSRTFRSISSYRFARRTSASNPLVSYAVEHSDDVRHWISVTEDQLAITALGGEWEEVRFNLPIKEGLPGFFRVGITSLQESPGGSAYLSPGDLDANGIDDLVQYAFDLQLQGGMIPLYDPERTERKQGLPILSRHQGLCSAIRYARLRKSAAPGVNYRIEESTDIKHWTTLHPRFIAERVIRTNGGWDDVEAIIMDSIHARRFYRVCLDLTDPLPV